MAYSCKILLDSIAPSGSRLTTFEVTFPRIVLAEFNTHRMLSRNSASSRAIPVEKMIRRVLDDPFVPARFPKNQSGMQAAEYYEPGDRGYENAAEVWRRARNAAVEHAQNLLSLKIHKQIANRLLEPFLWHTVIVSATTYDNFFALRCHPEAQPEIQTIAYMMRDAREASTPYTCEAWEWRKPLVDGVDREQLEAEGYDDLQQAKISVGRCARVSYLTHHGVRDPQADIDLHDRLIRSGHWSPLEHVARAGYYSEQHMRSGNFIGWRQYRKAFEPFEGRGPMPA